MKPALMMMLKSDPDIREAVAEIARGTVGTGGGMSRAELDSIIRMNLAPKAPNRDDEIAQAIRDLAGIEGAFTDGGKPKVTAIEQAMGGVDISAADRDRVWAAMQDADAA